MNKVTIYRYDENKPMRTLNLNGEPWFVLRDVCEVLGLGNSRMVADRLDEDEKGVSQIDTLGGVQNATIISESGLYNVILRSDKPEAKPFRKWVTAVVLPSIRKNGGYIAGQEELSPQELMAKALLVAQKTLTDRDARIKELTAQGQTEEEAKKNAPVMLEAQEMLRKWEAKDPEVYSLWETMNGWVYEGFDVTYKALGVDFDKIYYESQTYLLGKSLVEEGLRKGVFYRRDDNSVWIDLTADGLDEKLLLRGDGTSVYMTQDLGTAYRRFEENRLDDMIYVVGNEQNYHFQVLKLILKKLGYADWSDHITHLSYGMVELPEGKMKSREGTVVDADDLIADMVSTAREMSDELGKLDGCTEEEADAVSTMVGLGALKYFILKVDPKKTMLFDPRESIDFNGNTGPFIQYTHARICSVLRKAAEAGIDFSGAAQADYLPEEIALVKSLTEYPSVVAAAGENFAPSIVGAYVYELAKQFNGYYHDHSILKEENAETRRMRLQLAQQVARVIRSGMKLLGIDVPERM